jgi:nitrite reductase (cytochrome c-552)
MTETAMPTRRRWAGPLIALLLAAVVVLVGLLASSIMERRWEAQRPALVLKPLPAWEPDNAKWGENYPFEYESYAMTRDSTTTTLYGGSVPRDYLDEDPRLVILFAGYPFSADYRQARGHYHAVEDVTGTKRTANPATVGTCMTCKSTDVPRLMAKLGVSEFYHTPFHELKKEIQHPIGCQDCHDPASMNLRITRPALREAFQAQGKDIDQATHQEMRALVCAQCHVEYYFKDKYYLTFPWQQGMTLEQILAYYEGTGHVDYVHPISKTPILKAQHPDYELWSTGVHAYRGVTCADCHMPYRSEGALKYTNHHVQSPLLDIANSCAVCHRWSEGEVKTRVESIQAKVAALKLKVEDALVAAHFDVGAAAQAGAEEAGLTEARKLVRQAQFRWDFIAASNGMGFHSPQETMRVLADAVDLAQQARLQCARLLAQKGISAPPRHPDVSTREKAWAVAQAFVQGSPPDLLGQAAPAVVPAP